MEKKKITKTQIVSWVGTLLMVASLVFLARRLFLEQADSDFYLMDLFTTGVVIGLVIVAIFEGIGILLAALNFRALVRNVSGVLVKLPLGLVVYTISNLYKYIPGGVMYVVGRNRLALETEELSHPKVALSTVLEGIIIAFAAITIIVFTVFDHAMDYIRQLELPRAFAILLIVIVVLAGSAAFSFRHKIKEGLTKLFDHMRVLSIPVLIKRFGFGLIIMVLWASTFLATLLVLGQPLEPSQMATVIGLFLLSWLVGFLTPGAPSGIGIREIVMLMFMGGILYEEILLAAMLMHRIVAASGDIAAYGVAVGYGYLTKKEAV
ncbi:MAG: hypothetical protein FWC73_08675 [Defluviitaleaceae bacterium]|nr:hypothetical protein [Defluviitaleaceae bacterium]